MAHGVSSTYQDSLTQAAPLGAQRTLTNNSPNDSFPTHAELIAQFNSSAVTGSAALGYAYLLED